MARSLAHVEINVSDLKKSGAFWSTFLSQLDWSSLEVGHQDVLGFKGPDRAKIFLVQTEKRFLGDGYHRKRIGLNHFVFRVESADKVDAFAAFLEKSNIPILYTGKPKDFSSEYATKRYYAVFFEDPDRIKLEVVYEK